MDLKTLRTPCYTLDLAIAKNNANVMIERAESLGCTLRPHVKTHKTIEGALLQTGGRKSGIVVSTIKEAEFYADNGFTDILYAVPITPDKVPAAAALSNRTLFHVVVDSESQLKAVLDYNLDKKWSIFIMVDCGYHRDGIDPESSDAIKLADEIVRENKATLTGLYTHGGHSYNAPSPDKIQEYSIQERDSIVLLSQKLSSKHKNLIVGVGSTPTCSKPPSDGLKGITEMHPGNYITFDYNQCVIGSCTIDQVAVRVLTRIVGIYPDRNMFIVDLGWTGCSAQGAAHNYGSITSHPELQIKVLKQESGEVIPKEGIVLDWNKYKTGDILELAPWHSCAVGALHHNIIVKEGDNVSEWLPCRGW